MNSFVHPLPPSLKTLSLLLVFITGQTVRGEALDYRTFRSSNEVHARDVGSDPRPCCLPYRFQAVIVNLPTFTAEEKEVTRLYRNWDERLQIQESATFTKQGTFSTVRRVIMDYKNMVQYVYTPGQKCVHNPIDHGMLEPCMPENSTYLGSSYIGAYSEKTDFQAWYFRRTDLNRDIEMTIIVTSDRCVPVSEHITGRIGSGRVDGLVMFTNVTEVVDDQVFNIPKECLGLQPM